MLRNQLILSVCLAVAAVVMLLVNDQTSLNISAEISPYLLFPLRTASRYVEFLYVSRDRINDLEIKVSNLELENTRLARGSPGDSAEPSAAAYSFITAHVIGRDPSDFNGFLYIDKGRRDGLYANQPVVISGRLVGKLKQAGDRYSIVETIENRNIAVSAVDRRSGVNGIVKYRDILALDYVKIYDDVSTGDSIYTSGMSDALPPGILVATVARVYETGDLLFKRVELVPAVLVNRLHYVHILVGADKTSIPDQVRNDMQGAPVPGAGGLK